MEKNPPANTRGSKDIGSIPECREDPLEQGMAIHSSIFAWRIPWTEKPRGLQLSVAESVNNRRLSTHSQLLFMILLFYACNVLGT